MRYFVLYDERGQAQRIAETRSANEALQYLSADFTEVDEQTYRALVGIADPATIADLALLTAAATALTQILGRRGQQQQAPIPDQNRSQFTRMQQALEREFDTITDDYLNERINIDQWQRRMQDAVNKGNLASRIAGKNGVSNMTQADLDRVQRANQIQAEYIARFRRRLRNGEYTPAEAMRIARMYSGSLTPVFEEAITDSLGLPTLPAYPAVRTSCMTNCKCSWDIRQLAGNGNFDCFWRLAPAEHCDECLARSRAFNPLRIRGGVIQPFNPVGIYV